MQPSTDADRELRALQRLSPEALAADVAALVREPSVTGQERSAIERLAELAERLGLTAAVHEHDLTALRGAPGYPGEEAPRTELLGATVHLGDASAARRLCFNGHLDVVAPGTGPWRHPPFSGLVEDGLVHGVGSVDMKGGVVAALHAMAAVGAAGDELPVEVVLQGVCSEEDGGLGSFAALERDSRFDACVIPEPTSFAAVVAHGGALTFGGVVRGTAAHAAVRLAGVSAIDRYVRVHHALAAHEARVNAAVDHPLMGRLALPYPLLVGKIEGGRWSSQVPDEVRFEGRLGVRVGETREAARAAFEQAVAGAQGDDGPPVEIAWEGGQFGACETAPDHPFVTLVRDADPLGAPVAGVSYGADMRLFVDRGIPCVMYGTSGLELAHAADERVPVADVLRLAQTMVRLILRFAAAG